MTLKMRPTGLGHGVYKDNVDYSVFCGEWCIGRIYYKTRTGPEHLRWFWALHFSPQAREPAHRQSRGVTGSGEGGIRRVLAQVEGVGQAGRGALAGIRLLPKPRRRW
jgi:hypothetical protein